MKKSIVSTSKSRQLDRLNSEVERLVKAAHEMNRAMTQLIPLVVEISQQLKNGPKPPPE